MYTTFQMDSKSPPASVEWIRAAAAPAGPAPSGRWLLIGPLDDDLVAAVGDTQAPNLNFCVKINFLRHTAIDSPMATSWISTNQSNFYHSFILFFGVGTKTILQNIHLSKYTQKNIRV